MRNATGSLKMDRTQTCKRIAKDAVRVSNESCSSFLFEWKNISTLSFMVRDGYQNMSFMLDGWKIYAAGIVLITLCYALYIWFSKYKLRYLLRLNLMIFNIILIVRFLCFMSLFFEDFAVDFKDYICSENLLFNKPQIVWVSTLSISLILFVRFHWSLPLNIKKKLHQVGFNHLKHSPQNIQKTIEQLTDEKFRCFSSEMPPVYPNGWIPILESAKLLRGSSKTITAIGQKFCIFRGSEGIAYILDAYCPHLGAELASGGVVRNGCIECPFHEWQFDGESGKCIKIPYAKKVPNTIKINTWPSCEMNGFIFVWHHAEKHPPSWEMPTLENVESGHWKFKGRTEHEVHCHIQEIPENGADIAHLNVVHSKSVFSGQFKSWSIADLLLDCIEHEWLPCGWEKDENQPYIGKIKLSQRMRIYGKSLPFLKLDMNIEQIGPATVHLQMETSFGKAVLLQHIIPEAPLNHRIIHILYAEPKFQQFAADIFILSEAVMLERDIAIWNNKRFLKSPTLVKEDQLIKTFRRWYSQFYSENSPTLKDIRQKSLDW